MYMTCSHHQIRVYCCRECQKADYKLHKRYCRTPDPPNRLTDLEMHCVMLRLNLGDVVKNATDPNDVASLEDSFAEIVPKWPVMPRCWSLDGALDELRTVPKLNTLSWAVSFATFGTMDKRTGRLLYNLVVGECERPEVQRLNYLCVGRPTAADLEQMIYLAIARPREGPPYRPRSILLANRWLEAVGRDAVDSIIEKVGGELDVRHSRLESRFEAEMTAHNNDTDPDGNNFD